MADLTITATSVVPQSGATIRTATAAAAITAGQILYLNSSGQAALADANALASAEVVGMAVCNAAAGQAVSYIADGRCAMGTILTAGAIYVLSSTAGGLCPAADLSSTEYTSIVGVATSTSVLSVKINNSGALTA